MFSGHKISQKNFIYFFIVSRQIHLVKHKNKVEIFVYITIKLLLYK